MKRKRICLILAAIFAISCSPIYAAKNVTNAYSPDVSETVLAYKSAYQWNDSYLVKNQWRVRVPGKGYQTFYRMHGYQDYFLADNILATRKFLGLTDGIYQTPENVIIPSNTSMLSIATKELREKDNREVPKGSNKVKYNTWYGGEGYADSWSCTFIAYCAEKAEYIDGSKGKFIKTANIERQYQHLKKQFPTHELGSTTPFGGASYTPISGDIIFFASGSSYKYSSVGMIAGISANGIYVIEGDKDDQVKKTLYSVDDIEAIKNSVIVHVVY